MEVLQVFKGTDKDMKCRGMQYEIGKKVESEDAVRCGSTGFHSCESPLDVLRYYPMRDGNRYFAGEAEGKIDRGGDDSKIASSVLSLKAEVGIAGLIKAHFEYTRKKAASGTAGGDESNLAGGYKSNLAGGYKSNLAGGYESNLAGGNSSLLVGKNGSKAKGGLHSVIVLTEWEYKAGEYIPVCVKAEIVDGVNIKADVFYRLKNGKFEEVEG